MVYKWKIPGVIPVDAQTAGEEFYRIYQTYGKLEPEMVVNENRPIDAPLHPCFEWDDAVAAEEYRKVQAAGMIRAITVEASTKENKPIEVRAFVHTKSTYTPVDVAANSQDQMQELLDKAFAELEAFRRKYSVLQQLRPIFDAIEKIGA